MQRCPDASTSIRLPSKSNSIFRAEWLGVYWTAISVPYALSPYALTRFFSIPDQIASVADLIVGKLLMLKGAKTWKTLSDSPTLNP